jgi:small nuclear ribonucleoprotein (snRNP)-like protein
MKLHELAANIVAKLKNDELTRGDLNAYFNYCKVNLTEVRNIQSVNDAKDIATPFIIMLSNPDFTSNEYLWQTICSKAYYTASFYLQTAILDAYNTPEPTKLMEYIELLKVRLMVLLNGKMYFPDLLFRVPKNPNKKNWSPLSDSGTSDIVGFKHLVMADAGLISKYASSPLLGALHQDTLQFANSVISDNSNLLTNLTIEEIIGKGLELHKLLFNYLDNRLTNEGTLDFHTDDDD